MIEIEQSGRRAFGELNFPPGGARLASRGERPVAYFHQVFHVIDRETDDPRAVLNQDGRSRGPVARLT